MRSLFWSIRRTMVATTRGEGIIKPAAQVFFCKFNYMAAHLVFRFSTWTKDGKGGRFLGGETYGSPRPGDPRHRGRPRANHPRSTGATPCRSPVALRRRAQNRFPELTGFHLIVSANLARLR